MKGFLLAFALMRVYRDQLRTPKNDLDFEYFCITAVTPIRVYWTKECAEAEAARLNALNGHKGAYYFCSHTRLEGPARRAAGT